MKTFGETLKELMKAKRLSATDIAKILQLPTKSVQEWVGPSGRTPRDLSVIKKLASLFGVSVHYLMYGEEDPHNLLASALEKTEIHTGLYEIVIRKVQEKK